MLDNIDIPLLIGILISMVLSAFFSGMEIAFVSSNRMRAEMDKEKSVFTQKLLSVFYSHPNGFVSTMLVGNNIVLVVYGILFAKFFDKTLFELPTPYSRPSWYCSPANFCPRRCSRTMPTSCLRSFRP